MSNLKRSNLEPNNVEPYDFESKKIKTNNEEIEILNQQIIKQQEEINRLRTIIHYVKKIVIPVTEFDSVVKYLGLSVQMSNHILALAGTEIIIDFNSSNF